MIKNRIEFTYYPEDDSYQEYVSLAFEVPEDMHMAQLQRIFRKCAFALGYSEVTINKYLGEDSDDDF